MATSPRTQKAWVYKEYGPKENLSMVQVMVPNFSPDQVLVKVHAASLNPVDVTRRLGCFKRIGGSDSQLPTVPGYDVAGVVAEVGKNVTKFKVGDRVYGDISEKALGVPKHYGTLAEYTVVEEKLIAAIPERLSFAEAAALPLTVLTAYQALGFGGLAEGKTVLILGGSGGVGSLAVQVAKHVYKASIVAATANTSKVEFVKSLGADIVIDHQKDSLAIHPRKYDVVLDTIGMKETCLALKVGGCGVVLNGEGKPPVRNFSLTSRGEDLEKLNPFFQNGSVKPIMDSKQGAPFKFSEVVQAYARLEEGRATGKIVISPTDG